MVLAIVVGKELETRDVGGVRALVTDAEQALEAARAEHAARGDSALDGSQLSELLAGQGGVPTITAY